MQEYQSIVLSLLEGQNISFIGSVDGVGYPQIRAMLRPRLWEGIGIIYFSTNTPTNKVAQFRGNSKACVYICDAAAYRGALLTGNMEVLENVRHKALLWQPGDELYYPGGKTDPNYCVLRFTAHTGRIYSDLQSISFSLEGVTRGGKTGSR